MFSKKGTIIIFLSFLFLPFILGNLNIPALFKEIKSSENRAPAKKPELNINSLDGYPPHYSEYYNDHFPFRDVLLQIYAFVKTRCFDESPVPDKVIVGKDDWLFYKEGEQGLYDGSKKLSDSALDVYLNELQRRKKILDQRNCSLYIYVVPAKLVVYPEYLKRVIKKHNEQTEGQQLVEYITKRSDIHITYLLSALTKAKDTNRPFLYYKTDTHWSNYGALIGCNEIIRQLSSAFPDMKPFNINEMATEDSTFNAGNIATMMQAPGYYTETKRKILPKIPIDIRSLNQDFSPTDNSMSPWRFQRIIPDTTLPNVLIVGDSFMEYSMGFLAASFNHTAFVWDGWKYKFYEDAIDKVKPNVMIYIMWEPELENILYNLK